MSLATIRALLAAERGDSNVSFGDPVEEPAEEPKGVAQVVTPSGLEIYYQAAPKRLYRIRKENRQYPHEAWTEVPSVSTVLDVLEKGGLSIWGQRIGTGGVLELIERGELLWVED